MSVQMPARHPVTARPRERGLTLVEVLIALLILSIGLLGLAGLQTASLKFNTSAYYRTQATALAYGLADRMRANRAAALVGSYDAALEDPAPACGAPDLSGTVPQDDISTWRMALACRLPLGNGSVARNGDDFTLTVQWDDSHGEDAPLQFQFTTGL
ncbi:MAG TPA: type IV pilus modification protein PilV [Woeseiaceae bacterium]|nr:type IV pilus modification protein PilV [Woeseiaceae bacterium]